MSGFNGADRAGKQRLSFLMETRSRSLYRDRGKGAVGQDARGFFRTEGVELLSNPLVAIRPEACLMTHSLGDPAP